MLHAHALPVVMSGPAFWYTTGVTGGGAKRWKHSPALDPTANATSPDGELHVVVVRHPLPWAESMRRVSYDIACNGEQRKHPRERPQPPMSFASISRGPCRFTLSEHEPEPRRLEYANLFALWNDYHRGFLAAAHARGNVRG